MKTKEAIEDRCCEIIGKGIQIFFWLITLLSALALGLLFLPMLVTEEIQKKQSLKINPA